MKRGRNIVPPTLPEMNAIIGQMFMEANENRKLGKKAKKNIDLTHENFMLRAADKVMKGNMQQLTVLQMSGRKAEADLLPGILPAFLERKRQESVVANPA